MLSEQEYINVLDNYKDKEEPKKEVTMKKNKILVTKKEEKQNKNVFSNYEKSTYKKILDKTVSILGYGFGFMTYFLSIMIWKVIVWIVKKMQNIMEKKEKKMKK